MPRPRPPIKLVTQRNPGDTKWDDCAPSCTAMLIRRGGYSTRITWREVRYAMEVRGVHDRPDKADPTTPEQNARAFRDITGDDVHKIYPKWEKLKSIIAAGGGAALSGDYAKLPPSARHKDYASQARASFGHSVYVEDSDTPGSWLLYDPLEKAASKPKLVPIDIIHKYLYKRSDGKVYAVCVANQVGKVWV
jgi:hypothetical protein